MTRTPPAAYDALVCDLDGVIYRGSRVVPGAPEAIADMRARGIKIVFATNNATHTVEEYQARLANIGIETVANDIVTSAIVTVEEIERRGWTDRSIYLVGGEGIRARCIEAGLHLIEGNHAREADMVIVSGTPRLTYDHLRTAAFAVRNGAAFLATNADPTFPAPDGLWPGAGAIVAAIQVASGGTAEVLGKPNRPMMEAIARRLPAGARVAAIGDQPGTDLSGARAMGWATILVLSGVTDAAAAAALPDPPDLVVPTIVEAGSELAPGREKTTE